MKIAFFGSSLVSSYWNGAATYYRGLIRALDARGHRVTFFEPKAFDRQANRDIADPPWAAVVVFEPTESAALAAVERARDADVLVKASGVGVLDDLLEEAVLDAADGATAVFWDVDAPATLARLEAAPDDPLRTLVPRYDLILTYGGGEPVVRRYRDLGARECVPIYNALDPETHHPGARDRRFACDLAFLGNRLPDREARVEEFFLRAAELAPGLSFLLAGAGWDDKPLPPNVRVLGHVSTNDHNAFNSTPLVVLNVLRESMAENGWSPATRVFEAAGAAACLISDDWQGIEAFLDPGREVLVARSGDDVAKLLHGLVPERAGAIGRAARRRVLREHTYAHRAEQVESILSRVPA
ncbi:MAG: glycosyltransferase [Gaiellaceae bacterium]